MNQPRNLARRPKLQPSSGLFSIVTLGAFCMVAAQPSTALAFISESSFDRTDESTGAQRLESVRSAAQGFVSKRVLRTQSKTANQMFSLSGGQSTQVKKDALDNSTVLRRGDLGLDLGKMSLGGGKSIQDELSGPVSDARRNELLTVISQAVVTKLKSDSSLAFRSGYLALDREKSHLSAEFVSLSYSLFIKGKRVDGANMSARFNNGLWISWVSNAFGSTEGKSTLLDANEKIALQSVAQDKLGPAFQRISNTESVWVPDAKSNSYDLIPAARATLTDKNGQTYTLTVSEHDGQILEFYAHLYNFEGTISGSYYSRHPESPVLSAGMPYVTVKSGGIFGRKTFTANKDGKLKVPRVDEVVVRLSSPYFNIKNNGGEAAELTTKDDAKFEPGQNASAAETTTYFHAHVVSDFVRERIAQKLPWLDKQITANVNLSSHCNAFYNGSSINFFSAGTVKRSGGNDLSCNNTGEISDVVYHEWGHGLDDNTGGIDDGAFSEAIGDVTSMLITNSPEVGPYFLTDGKPVRNLEGEYQYPPKDEDREVHVEGLIFGSTWYHLTQAMIKKYGADVGRDTSARLFLKLIYASGKYTEAYDAAVDIDATRGDKGPNFCLINQAFARHGLATKDSSCNS